NSRIARVSDPRRPSTLTRISSSASGDGASAISARIASVEGWKSAIRLFSQTKGADGLPGYSTPRPGLNRYRGGGAVLCCGVSAAPVRSSNETARLVAARRQRGDEPEPRLRRERRAAHRLCPGGGEAGQPGPCRRVP